MNPLTHLINYSELKKYILLKHIIYVPSTFNKLEFTEVYCFYCYVAFFFFIKLTKGI